MHRILCSFLLMLAAFPLCRAQDVLIVANPGVRVAAISSGELRDIFTGARSTFRDRSRAVPVVLKGGPVHEVFVYRHLHETPDSLRALWRKATFTGQGAPPREFNSEAALTQYVSETPGAIGYVSRVVGAANVKILIVSSD